LFFFSFRVKQPLAKATAILTELPYFDALDPCPYILSSVQ